MSWHGGDYIMIRLRDACNEAKLTDEQRKLIYAKMLEEIRQQDGEGFDGMGKDSIYDEVIFAAHPGLKEEDALN